MLARIHRSTIGLDHIVTQRFTQALCRQLVGIQLACAGVLANFFVHQRLRQCRRILLVVAQFAKADDVHHHVLAKFHAELKASWVASTTASGSSFTCSTGDSIILTMSVQYNVERVSCADRTW